MKRNIIIAVFLLIRLEAFSLSADEIVSNTDKTRGVSSICELLIHMEDYSMGKLSETSDMKGYIKGSEKSMIIYTAPFNMKNRKILSINDDMWVFIPDTQKPVRVTASQRLLGQASNGDVLKIRFETDYSPVLSGEQTIPDIDGIKRNCYKLDLNAKRTGATYKKVILWVEKETYYPVKEDCFTLSGKKLKTVFYSGIKNFESRNTVTKMTIFDEVVTNNFTTIENFDEKSADIDDKYFNREYLKRM
ncbi:MAG: outer membrane lipoprotein-sorting protein [Brevinematales bacterium]|jgi:hypothetical protein